MQGVIKQGFDVGKLEELKEQAMKGGVRLPGKHSIVTAHRSIYTDPTIDMQGFVKPGDVLRLKGIATREC